MNQPSLLRNDMRGTNHWLKIKLVGTKSNRSAIGTRVVAHYGKKAQAQELLSQSSFYSVNDSRLHFGPGAEKTADITIRWPSGAHEELKTRRGRPTDSGKGRDRNRPRPRLVKTRRVKMPCIPARLSRTQPSARSVGKKLNMLRFAALE